VRLAAGWNWLQAGAEPRDAIALGDPRYPAALLASPDPPLLLYARGRIELLRSPAIAIVGSRNTTAQGLENARAFSADLSNVGWTVVSGLALGIDAAAHEGALAGGGTTIAVVGTDHRPARRRRGPRGVRDSRLDPLATIARLPCPDQARRQVGRQRRRHR
jgi:DNA processing protein